MIQQDLGPAIRWPQVSCGSKLRASNRGLDCASIESPGGLHGANHRPGRRGSDRPILGSDHEPRTHRRPKDMRRNTRSLLLAPVAAAAPAATGGGWAATAKSVNGTVGAVFALGLTRGTTSFVLRPKKGSYRFACDRTRGSCTVASRSLEPLSRRDRALVSLTFATRTWPGAECDRRRARSTSSARSGLSIVIATTRGAVW